MQAHQKWSSIEIMFYTELKMTFFVPFKTPNKSEFLALKQKRPPQTTFNARGCPISNFFTPISVVNLMAK